MTRKTLIYRWDEQDGRMRVQSRDLRLSDHDCAVLESELGRQYESLLARLEGGEAELIIRFHAVLTECRRITGFRVRLHHGVTARCPELILEPVLAIGAERRQPANTDTTAAIKEPSSAGVGEPAAGRAEAADGPRELAVRNNSPWVAGFMEDVKRRLCDRPPDELTNADRAAILFTLAELQDLCRDRPEHLAVVLLAGYVSLGQRMCEQVRPEDARWYRSAARVLDRVCGWDFSQDAVQPSAGVPRDGTIGSIRRITQFLSRALGLQDEDAWE